MRWYFTPPKKGLPRAAKACDYWPVLNWVMLQVTL